MYELKTKLNDASVEAFLNTIEDEEKRKDAFIILGMMKEITGKEPKMWGPAMIGFGEYSYKYASGHSGDWFIIGFSPRKANLSLYFMGGLAAVSAELEKLGKYKTSKGSCLYVTKLKNVDLVVLKDIIGKAYKHTVSMKPKEK